MVRCVKATMAAMMSGEGTPYRDINACREWLTSEPDCTGKVGIVGFCMGGGFALMTANRGLRRPPTTARCPGISTLPWQVPALWWPATAPGTGASGAAARLEAGLESVGVPHDVKEYLDAGHSFMDRINVGPFSPLVRVAGFGYRRDSAEDAWARILRFFEAHLRGT